MIDYTIETTWETIFYTFVGFDWELMLPADPARVAFVIGDSSDATVWWKPSDGGIANGIRILNRGARVFDVNTLGPIVASELYGISQQGSVIPIAVTRKISGSIYGPQNVHGPRPTVKVYRKGKWEEK